MKLIAHRGNINGKLESWENEPTYIDLALSKGYDVEIDVWCEKNILSLGHDSPLYGGLSIKWFNDRKDKLWVHCKNVEALVFFKKNGENINYFWHENDTATLTSKGYIWAFPTDTPIDGSIAVMPELFNGNLSKCSGICSDFISNYK